MLGFHRLLFADLLSDPEDRGSDTLVYSYQTSWNHIPQDSILHHLNFLVKVCYFAMKASQAARHDKMQWISNV
jgi:hypothetical protein